MPIAGNELTAVRPPSHALVGSTVLNTIGRDVHIERSGAWDPSRQKRVAILAHWSATPVVTRSVAELCRALTERGYGILLVSTCEAPGRLHWGETPPPPQVTVLRRPNVGYDFGSWAVGVAHEPAVRSAPFTLMLNDSFAGPFSSIDHVIDDFEKSKADVWGVTESRQFGPHLQSYMVGYRGGVLGASALKKFWSRIKVQESKEKLILKYELGLTKVVRRNFLSYGSFLPAGYVVYGDENPAIVGWRRLLDRGFPLVKRELIRTPTLVRDGNDLRQELTRRFGVDVDDWI